MRVRWLLISPGDSLMGSMVINVLNDRNWFRYRSNRCYVVGKMEQPDRHFIAPNLIAGAVNRFYGWLTSLGLGPSYSFQLQITGRKTGKVYSTPVNVLRFDGKIYLVGTRGHTQWSRNALVAKQVTLKRGRVSMRFHLRALTEQEKPEILRAYLSRFAWMTRRFFPVSASAPVTEFAAIGPRYPVFELLPDSPEPKIQRNPA